MRRARMWRADPTLWLASPRRDAGSGDAKPSAGGSLHGRDGERCQPIQTGPGAGHEPMSPLPLQLISCPIQVAAFRTPKVPKEDGTCSSPALGVRRPGPLRSPHGDGKSAFNGTGRQPFEAYAGKAKIVAASITRTVDDATWERLVLGAWRPIRRLTPNTRDASVRAPEHPYRQTSRQMRSQAPNTGLTSHRGLEVCRGRRFRSMGRGPWMQGTQLATSVLYELTRLICTLSEFIMHA
jgi:hypothetical protein